MCKTFILAVQERERIEQTGLGHFKRPSTVSPQYLRRRSTNHRLHLRTQLNLGLTDQQHQADGAEH